LGYVVFLLFVLTWKLACEVPDGEGPPRSVDDGVWPGSSFSTFFEGPICAFPPSSAWHASSSCIPHRLLVRDPLATAVVRCGVGRVVTTRLGVFHLGLCVYDHTPSFEAVAGGDQRMLVNVCWGAVPRRHVWWRFFMDGSFCVSFSVLFCLSFSWQVALWLLTWSVLLAQTVWPTPRSSKVIC
jgi:hypothetical protein